jgi:hypothetical protein
MIFCPEINTLSTNLQTSQVYKIRLSIYLQIQLVCKFTDKHAMTVKGHIKENRMVLTHCTIVETWADIVQENSTLNDSFR